MMFSLLSCGNDPKCECRVNEDGTSNFRAEYAGGNMVIKVGGDAYIKTHPGEMTEIDYRHGNSFWKDLRTGLPITYNGTLKSLEACSLLYEWKRQGIHQLLVDDTTSVRVSDK